MVENCLQHVFKNYHSDEETNILERCKNAKQMAEAVFIEIRRQQKRAKKTEKEVRERERDSTLSRIHTHSAFYSVR